MIAHRVTPQAIFSMKSVVYVTRFIGFLLFLHFLYAGGGWSHVALAQSPITAEVDRTTVSTDEELLLTVTVNGELVSIPRPDLSSVEDFAVVSSGTSTQISIINGQLTSQGIFRYRLRPLQAGDAVIPPIRVTIDGQNFQTEPISIKVEPGVSPTVPVATPQEQQQQSGQGGLSREEAEQLLDTLGQNSQTLQERLQLRFGTPATPPLQDW